MLLIVRLIIVTYILAVNVYSFLLINSQKKQREERRVVNVKDSKIIMTGMLGGATGIYLAMFIFSYRLQSFFLMVLIPILILLNAYLFIVGFTGNPFFLGGGY